MAFLGTNGVSLKDGSVVQSLINYFKFHVKISY